MQLTDLSGWPFEKADRYARELVATALATPFKLDCGPVIRINLIRVTPTDHRLAIVVHHIVADVPSCRILVSEIERLYAQICLGKSDELELMQIQYGDYAVWERAKFQGEQFGKRIAYWREYLRPPIPILGLPCDRPRPLIQTFKGASISVTVPDDAATSCIEFCKKTRYFVCCKFGCVCGCFISLDRAN